MKQITFVIVSGLISLSIASAQMPGGPPPEGCAALAKFLSRDAAFTATAKVVSTGKKRSDNQSMVLYFAVHGGNMRNEMDMTKMSGIAADDVEGMKQMGMDKMVILKLAEKKAAYMVYPSLQAYCDMPAVDKKGDTEGTVEKTELGKESVENHPCKKSKLTFTDKNGQTAEAIVWEATDMDNFPVQYQTIDDGQTVTTTFTDIKHGKPAAALFELPASYKKYGSMQEMMMGNMQRMMQME
jgi:outer membrane lipoprotein-sorting protein